MSELDRQRDVIHVVKDMGGHAYKSSNQWLVGICDLVVKVPYKPVAFLEAKLNDAPKRSAFFRLGLTSIQEKFLRDMDAAGAYAGVISFVQGPGKRDKSVRIIPFNKLEWTHDGKHAVEDWADYKPGTNWKDEIRRALTTLPGNEPRKFRAFE